MDRKVFRGTALFFGLILILLVPGRKERAGAVEIPLESVQPVRIGYIDLQKVFDTYPEKAFAEGDLLKEIQKRKTELVRRQVEINTLRQQIAADQSALDQARAGHAATVPHDDVAALQPPQPPTPEAPPPQQVDQSTAPYPTDEPLAGLPGHDATISSGTSSTGQLPGMQSSSSALLDNLAAVGTPTLLTAEAQTALQKRIDDNKHALDHETAAFKSYRQLALDDMKQLQTQKTYGVMSKIYAELQALARDENVTVVLDKAYVLYGEDTVDLSDKLIARLNSEQSQ